MPRILIVDSNPLLSKGISHILETNGYEVIGNKKDGESAILACLDFEPEMMIIDMRLTNPHVLEVIKTIKKSCHKIKIIAMETKKEYLENLQYTDLGIDEYIVKYELTKNLISHVENAALINTPKKISRLTSLSEKIESNP